MKLISPLLTRIVYPVLAGAGYFQKMARPGLAVVTYHGTLPQGYKPIDPALDGNLITAEALRNQIRLLKAHYKIILPEEVLLWSEGKFVFPPRSVLLTCDDGLVNHLTEMLPVLQEENVRCLFFVTGASASSGPATLWYEELLLLLLRAVAGSFRVSAGDVEISEVLEGREQRRALWWNAVKQLSQVHAEKRQQFLDVARTQLQTSGSETSANDPAFDLRFRLLNRDELRRLDAAGMTIGAHSMSHPLLSQLSPELAHAEIREGRACLEAVLGKRVWALAYPFGDPQSVTPEVLAMARCAGYTAAFLNYGGGLGEDLPSYAIPRIHVTANMGLSEFEAHATGFHARLRRAANRA